MNRLLAVLLSAQCIFFFTLQAVADSDVPLEMLGTNIQKTRSEDLNDKETATIHRYPVVVKNGKQLRYYTYTRVLPNKKRDTHNPGVFLRAYTFTDQADLASPHQNMQYRKEAVSHPPANWSPSKASTLIPTGASREGLYLYKDSYEDKWVILDLEAGLPPDGNAESGKIVYRSAVFPSRFSRHGKDLEVVTKSGLALVSQKDPHEIETYPESGSLISFARSRHGIALNFFNQTQTPAITLVDRKFKKIATISEGAASSALHPVFSKERKQHFLAYIKSRAQATETSWDLMVAREKSNFSQGELVAEDIEIFDITGTDSLFFYDRGYQWEGKAGTTLFFRKKEEPLTIYAFDAATSKRSRFVAKSTYSCSTEDGLLEIQLSKLGFFHAFTHRGAQYFMAEVMISVTHDGAHGSLVNRIALFRGEH